MHFSVSFGSSSNCLSYISSPICGPINIPSLIFASLTFGNLLFKYSNPRPVLYIPFTRFFMSPSFMCKGGQKNFLRRNKRRIDDIFLPWRQWCSFRPQFTYIVILLVPAVPLPQETAVFCVPELRSEWSATILRSPHNFHLNSSYLIFPNSSFVRS